MASTVSIEKLAISLVAALKKMYLFFLDSFQIFSLSLILSTLNVMSLDVVFIVFILFSVLYSWICGLISFISLGKFSVVISTTIALLLSSFPLLLGLQLHIYWIF